MSQRTPVPALLLLWAVSPAFGLSITEIQYAPGPAERFQFVEVLNDSPAPVDLSGHRFAEGIRFQFPDDFLLGAMAYVVVVADREGFLSRHPIGNVLGNFSGALSGNGEELVLVNEAGVPVARVDYQDSGKWTSVPAGTGYTLSLRSPFADPRRPENWTHSRAIGGTPGTENFPAAGSAALDEPRPARINEVQCAPGTARWLELVNASTAPLDLSGMYLSDDPGRLGKFRIPEGTLLPGGGFITFGEAQAGFRLDLSRVELVLTARDGRTIADARVFDRSTPSARPAYVHARLPDGTGRWHRTMTPTPGGPNRVELEREVVVNEIMYNPLVEPERGEYLELYNRGSRTVPLDGWRIAEGFHYDFLPGTAIPPGGYLVIGRDPEFLRRTYGLDAAVVLGPEQDQESLAAFGRLANDGEEIRIVDGIGNTVTEIRYQEGGEWPELADGDGSSLELIDPRQDPTFGSAWQASDETRKAAWKEYSYRVPYFLPYGEYNQGESEFWIFLLSSGQCLVDDVSILDDSGKEYCNRSTAYIGDFEVKSPAWRFEGTHVRSGYTDEDAHSGNRCLKVAASGHGNNEGNKVEMDTTPRMPVDSFISVRLWARWLEGSRALHTCGYSNAFARTHFLEVPPDLGTPGRENSARRRLRDLTGSDNLGPVITAVSHSPPVPGEGDQVLITVRVSDPDGVESVRCGYRINGRASPLAFIDLLDDGVGPDRAAGDGIWAGRIPPQPLLAKVLFFIEAIDRRGARRTFPLQAPERTLLYQVSEPVESGLFRFRLVLDDDNQRLLETRMIFSNDLLDAHVIFEESEEYYNVGARLHGGLGSRLLTPWSFRVKFPEDRSFRGFQRINLSHWGDTPNEGTSYYLIRKASGGQRARAPYTPRYTYFRTAYNGRPYAAHAEILPVDESYAGFWWPGDDHGFAYKVRLKSDASDEGLLRSGIQPEFRSYGRDQEALRFLYNPSSRRDDDNFEPLMELLSAFDFMETRTAALFQERIDTLVNVESFLRVLAIRALQGDGDTIGNSHTQNANACLYYAPMEGKFYLIPWDMNLTFESTGIPLIPGADPGIRRLLSTPKYRRAYLRILGKFTGSFWNPGPAPGIGPYLDGVAEATRGAGVGSPERIKNFMTDRIASVRDLLESAGAVPFAIATNDGEDFAVKSSSVRLSGTAPLEVAGLLVNGEVVEPAWSGSDLTTWSLDRDLSPGKNVFEFVGLDWRGEPVAGILRIAVYHALGWPAPEVHSVEPARGPAGGGIEVVVSGKGFQEGLRLLFGDVESPSVTVASAERARAVVPPAPAAVPGGGMVDITATNLDGQFAVLRGGFSYEWPRANFIRGDANLDLVTDLSDAISVLEYVFLGGSLPCLSAADATDNGSIDISDPLGILARLFLGAPPLPPPSDRCGPDPTWDQLGCDSSPCF